MYFSWIRLDVNVPHHLGSYCHIPDNFSKLWQKPVSCLNWCACKHIHIWLIQYYNMLGDNSHLKKWLYNTKWRFNEGVVYHIMAETRSPEILMFDRTSSASCRNLKILNLNLIADILSYRMMYFSTRTWPKD